MICEETKKGREKYFRAGIILECAQPHEGSIIRLRRFWRSNMKKPKLGKALLLCSPLLISSCSFFPSPSSKSSSSSSQGGGTSTSSPISQVPELIIHIDDKLIYDSAKKEYSLHLAKSETYQINADLGQYEGNEYTISYTKYVTSNTWLNLDEKGAISIDESFSYASSNTYVKVSMDKNGKSVQSALINVYAHGEYGDTISFTESDDLYYDESEYAYILKMRSGGEYQFNPKLEFFKNATFVYELTYGEEKFEISDMGLLKASQESFIGDYGRVRITAYVGDTKITTAGIKAIIADPHPELTAELVSDDERVSVKAIEDNYYGQYEINVPYGGNYYPCPKLSVADYTKETYCRFTPLHESLEFVEIDGVPCMKINQASPKYYYRVRFVAEVYDASTNELLKSVKGCAIPTGIGEGNFELCYGPNKTPIKDGDKVKIQCYIDTSFYLTYNGAERPLILAGGLSDSSIASIATKDSIRARKVGTVNASFSIEETDLAEVTRTYSISFTLEVIDESKPVKMEIEGGADAVSIVNGKVFTSKGVKVTFDIGREIYVTKEDGLVVNVEDTDKEDIKKVTFIFELRGERLEQSFNVKVSSSSSYPKRDMPNSYSSLINGKNVGAVTPKSGDVKGLVIPVWFTDSSNFINVNMSDADGKNQKEQIREDLNEVVFGEASDKVEWESVASYYKKESHGVFNYSGVVSDWFVVDYPSTALSNYKNPTSGRVTEDQLARAAFDWYFANSGKTVADFDSNGDGMLDALHIFYGANAYSSDYYSRAFNSNHFGSSDGFSDYSFSSAMDIYRLDGAEGETLETQLKTPDLSKLKNDRLEANTSIHEFGHSFGLTDYYDEYGHPLGDTTERFRPAGGFSMQDMSFGGHDAYSKLAIGWEKPYVFDASDYSVGDEFEIDISDSQSSGDLIMLTPKFDGEKGVFDEYFLLELYTPTGINEFHAKYYDFYYGSDDVGIRLWHVNSVIESYTRHKYTNWTVYSSPNVIDLRPDVLHLIREKEDETYKTANTSISEALFHEGDHFDMEKYSKQFYVNDGLMDSGKALGWTFDVSSIRSGADGTYLARITIKRV